MPWEKIRTSQSTMPVYHEAAKQGSSKGHVIVYQEIFGVTAQTRRVCERLAVEGYDGWAPDIFYRQGERFEATSYNEVQPGIERTQLLTDQLFASDLGATMAYLESATRAPVVAMGFCLGGRLSFLAATLQPLAGAICFYGGSIAQRHLGGAGNIRCPVMLLYGEKDAHIPMSDIDAIRRALQTHDVRHQIVIYPGAGHAFFNEDRPSYEPKAAKDAWENVKDFLQKACK